MAITHVIRGDDHVNNTPRQINILRALGAEPPVYAHLPTVLNEQGEKMSKRHGAKPVTQYRDEGFLADAVVNYLARLGWSHGDDEIFSREQLLQWFDLDHLGKSAGQFDEAKLRWVNSQHLKAARRRRRWRRWWSSSCSAAARRSMRAGSLARAGDRAVQGPLLDDASNWPTGWRCWSRRSSRRPTIWPPMSALSIAPALSSACRPLARCAVGQGRHRAPRSSRPWRTRAEDAAAGHRGAGAGLRACADAVGRCGAGLVRTQHGGRSLAKV